MNLYLRLLLALLSGWRGKSLPHDSPLLSDFRVWVHDLDAFGHMNNGRYLQIMDVARTEWMVRTGVLRAMWMHRWSAVLGGGVTRFRRPLRLGQRYRVRTRLLCWDHRWFYFEHVFLNDLSETVAVGVSRAALRRRNGWVGTGEVVAQVAPGAISGPVPDYLGHWLRADAGMFDAVAFSEPLPASDRLEVSS